MSKEKSVKTMTQAEWLAEGKRLYGDRMANWRFRCPQCGEVQTIHDFVAVGVKDPGRFVYFSCIGRVVEGRGCDWTLGGLFKIHKLEVTDDEGNVHMAFEFADDQPVSETPLTPEADSAPSPA